MALRGSQLIRRILLGAALLAGLMVPAAAAQAHDVLESTQPANGSSIENIPAKIGMTFNNTPTAIGSEILVQDSHGANWAVGPVEILDNQVSQEVKAGAPAGKYTVNWRVVSSDSHPIEGSFSFIVTAGGTATAPTTAATQDAAANESSNAGSSSGLLIVGAVIVVVVIAAVIVSRRRRQERHKPSN